jgi:hypothetical protein
MLKHFWDAYGPILEHYGERSTIVNSVHYSEMPRDWVKPATQTKHQELLLEGTIVLHNTPHLHTAAHTTESR